MNSIHKIRYDKFIDSRKLRKIPKDTYTEKHHIIPRALGGSDEPENIIRLTAREHFIAHLILWKIYGGSMTYAFMFMSKNVKYSPKLTSKQHARLRQDKPPCTIETRKKISEAKKGKNHHYYNKHMSEEHKHKISESQKGRIVSDMTRL